MLSGPCSHIITTKRTATSVCLGIVARKRSGRGRAIGRVPRIPPPPAPAFLPPGMSQPSSRAANHPSLYLTCISSRQYTPLPSPCPALPLPFPALPRSATAPPAHCFSPSCDFATVPADTIPISRDSPTPITPPPPSQLPRTTRVCYQSRRRPFPSDSLVCFSFAFCTPIAPASPATSPAPLSFITPALFPPISLRLRRCCTPARCTPARRTPARCTTRASSRWAAYCP